MHMPAYRYRDTHTHIHIWVYICTHKHSYKYFKIHEFTPIPPVAIHSQRVLSCLPAFYICISFFHRENSSFQQCPHLYSFVHLNTLVHLSVSKLLCLWHYNKQCTKKSLGFVCSLPPHLPQDWACFINYLDWLVLPNPLSLSPFFP